ncbi:hypothetical protein HNQ71_005370 [Mesorhizobium sangaii]|uniref:Uncharacterized protein n=1 Tax=Mesorhizobium sangaii TaxID=505389 RepID=A0A841PJ44_9HYPH|nr:hypothetical protein [Mesorhizobium sangaii]
MFDLLDRMTQNILEDHRAALKFGQPQKRLKADRDDVRFWNRRRFDVFSKRDDRVPGFDAQEIEARIVGDAEQPALEIIHSGALGSRVKGLDEGVLQYILAIDRRSRHARAVAVKAWPQRFQTILEFVRVHVSRPILASPLFVVILPETNKEGELRLLCCRKGTFGRPSHQAQKGVDPPRPLAPPRWQTPFRWPQGRRNTAFRSDEYWRVLPALR